MLNLFRNILAVFKVVDRILPSEVLTLFRVNQFFLKSVCEYLGELIHEIDQSFHTLSAVGIHFLNLLLFLGHILGNLNNLRQTIMVRLQLLNDTARLVEDRGVLLVFGNPVDFQRVNPENL